MHNSRVLAALYPSFYSLEILSWTLICFIDFLDAYVHLMMTYTDPMFNLLSTPAYHVLGSLVCVFKQFNLINLPHNHTNT